MATHTNNSNGGKKNSPPNKLRVPEVAAKGKSKKVQNNLRPIPFKMKR